MALTNQQKRRIRRELTKRWSDKRVECDIRKDPLLNAITTLDDNLDVNDALVNSWHSTAAQNRLTDRQRDAMLLAVLRERRDG